MREIGAYTPPPEYMPAPQRYITEPVIDALERYQEQKGIKIDGYAEPGGETERSINNDLLGKPRGAGLLNGFEIALKNNVGSGFRNDEDDVKTVKLALGALDFMPEDPFDNPSGFIDDRTETGIRDFQDSRRLKVDGWMRPGGETESALQDSISELRMKMQPAWKAYERKVRDSEPSVQPAQHTLPRPLPGPGRLFPPVQVPDGDLPEIELPKLPIPPLLGPLGDLSIMDRILGPRREKNLIPPEYRGFQDLSPTIDPSLRDNLIVEMRGNEDTQDQNDSLGRRFLSVAQRYGCPFEHIGGARKDFEKTGERKPERYIPANPQVRNSAGKLTTTGGAFGDVHLKTLKGKIRDVVLQTVDIVASRAPTARELANAAKILRNGGKDFYVLLFPKLPKGWTYDEGAFEALTRQLLDKVCNDEDRDDPPEDRQFDFDNVGPKR